MKEEYRLIASYVKQNYFVSTAYRRASTLEPIWYFETIVWEWNVNTKERGEMLEMHDSGMDEDMALDNHMELIKSII